MKSCGFSKQAKLRQVLVLLQLGKNALQLKLLRLSQHSWLGFIQRLPGSWNSIRIINRFFLFFAQVFIWSFLFSSFITLFFRSLRGSKFMEISESWSKRTLSSSFPSLLKRFPCVGIFPNKPQERVTLFSDTREIKQFSGSKRYSSLKSRFSK